MIASLATHHRLVHEDSPRRPSVWRRALALAVVACTAVALALPGEAAAAPVHGDRGAHAQSHAGQHHGARHCADASPRHAQAPGHHAP
ncbi:MAG TPA: hypothetical protein VF771_06915, partial [Longimicrobiaceae bacterium]